MQQNQEDSTWGWEGCLEHLASALVHPHLRVAEEMEVAR